MTTRSQPTYLRSEQGPGSPFIDYHKARQNELLQQFACGPLSLIAAANACGLQVSRTHQLQLIAEAGERGVSMLTLRQMAARIGLHAEGIHASISDLRNIGSPAIVHLDGHTFATITDIFSDRVQIVFPLQPPRMMKLSDLEEMFHGDALIVAPSPLRVRRRPPPDPGLTPIRLSSSVMSVGLVSSPSWTRELRLFNESSSDVALSHLDASCTCIQATLDLNPIPKGQCALLTVTGDIDSPGAFTYYITLVANGTQRLKIPVRGYVDEPILLTRPGALFRLVQGASTHESVSFELLGDFRVQDVSPYVSPSPPFTAQIIEKAGQNLSLRVNCDSQGLEPGEYSGLVELRLAGRKTANRSLFHVSAYIQPSVLVIPPTVTLSSRSGVWNREIRFLKRDGGTFDAQAYLQWDDVQRARNIVTELLHVNSSEMLLRLSLDAAGGNVYLSKPLNGHIYSNSLHIAAFSVLSSESLSQP